MAFRICNKHMKKIPLGEAIQATRKPGFKNYHRNTARRLARIRIGLTVARIGAVAISASIVAIAVKLLLEAFK